MYRTVAVGVLAALIVVACGDDGPGDPSDEVGQPKLERVTVDSPLALDSATGSDGTGARPQVAAVGRTLLAVTGVDPPDLGAEDGRSTLLRSEDRGATWTPVSLPESPPQLELSGPPSVHGDIAVVSGRAVVPGDADTPPVLPDAEMPSPAADAYVWTSRNGIDWVGSRVVDGGPAINIVEVFPAGDALLAASQMSMDSIDIDVYGEFGEFELLRSTDDGATWAPADVTALGSRQDSTVIEDVVEQDNSDLVAHFYSGSPVTYDSALRSRDAGRTWELVDCPLPAAPETGFCIRADEAGELLIRYDQVSLDEGATWQDLTIEGDACPGPYVDGSHPCQSVENVVELATTGWVGTTSGEYDAGTRSDTLVRSADGLRWQQLDLPEHCEVSGRYTRIRGPIAVGGSLLVGYSCSQPDGAPDRSELRLLDADGTAQEPVEDSRQDGVNYGQPFVDDDGVVVPELDEDGYLVSLLHVSP